jgi:hypothetical protein
MGIVAGAVVAATAFLAGARLPGTADSSTGAGNSAAGPLAELSARIRTGDSAAADRIAELLRLARSDDDAALAELAWIEDPRLRRDAALALLEEFGSDLEGIEQIAAALAPTDGLNFTFDAIALATARDPREAIAMAVALENPAAQTEALNRIAAALVASDPRAALGNVTAIANFGLADAFRTAVLEEWASLDPDGFFAFLETARTRDIPPRGDAFRIAASTDPRRLLALLDELPEALRSQAEQASLEALVRIDPAAAFARIDAMPGGEERTNLLRVAVRSLASHDLEAALAWLQGRPSASPEEISAVIVVLAEDDPVRAVDMLIANIERQGSPSGFFEALDGFTPGQPVQLALVADRLSAVQDAAVPVAFRQFMDVWAMDDADAALEWALANPDRLTLDAIQVVAMHAAAVDPELAKLAATRLPPDKRGDWIRSVAGRLAGQDIESTLLWLAGHQGQPYYETAVHEALQGLSFLQGGGDPRSIAAFLERQSPQLRADAAPTVGYFWASTDPGAAAQWAEGVDLGTADESRRRAILSNVATQWGLLEPDRARDWVLGLPPGAGRDQVLGSLLRATGTTGQMDTAVVDAYSSDASRREFLLDVLPRFGRTNPELGRTLIDRYFDEPEARAAAEQRLIDGAADQFGNSSSGILIY